MLDAGIWERVSRLIPGLRVNREELEENALLSFLSFFFFFSLFFFLGGKIFWNESGTRDSSRIRIPWKTLKRFQGIGIIPENCICNLPCKGVGVHT